MLSKMGTSLAFTTAGLTAWLKSLASKELSVSDLVALQTKTLRALQAPRRALSCHEILNSNACFYSPILPHLRRCYRVSIGRQSPLRKRLRTRRRKYTFLWSPTRPSPWCVYGLDKSTRPDSRLYATPVPEVPNARGSRGIRECRARRSNCVT